MVSYQDDLKRHLAGYKQRHLGIVEPGIFRYRGRDVPCHHILPMANASANLLQEAEAGATAFLEKNPRKRHRYFHHLNSSQAFAFNLFFPYFSCGEPKAAEVLLRALGQKGTLAKWEPEAIPVPDEETNIDVSWETMEGELTFCEVKLSETEFGEATDDPQHRAKFRDIYCATLSGHLEPSKLDPVDFLRAYQFNRNVWHMVRRDCSRLIFLLPRSNTSLWRSLQEMLLGVIPLTRGRISAVAIEDVIERLSSDDSCPKLLREYPMKLRQKYICGATM